MEWGDNERDNNEGRGLKFDDEAGNGKENEERACK